MNKSIFTLLAERKLKKLQAALVILEAEHSDDSIVLLNKYLDDAISDLSNVGDVATCERCRDFISTDDVHKSDAEETLCAECNEPDDIAYPSNAFFGIKEGVQ